MKREPNPYASNPILTVTNTMSISVPSMVAEDVIDGDADKVTGVDPAVLEEIKEDIKAISDEIDSTSRLAYGLKGYSNDGGELYVDVNSTGMLYLRMSKNGEHADVTMDELNQLVHGLKLNGSGTVRYTGNLYSHLELTIDQNGHDLAFRDPYGRPFNSLVTRQIYDEVSGCCLSIYEDSNELKYYNGSKTITIVDKNGNISGGGGSSSSGSSSDSSSGGPYVTYENLAQAQIRFDSNYGGVVAIQAADKEVNTGLAYYKIAAKGFVSSDWPNAQLRLYGGANTVELQLSSDSGRTWRSITSGGSDSTSSSGSSSDADILWSVGKAVYDLSEITGNTFRYAGYEDSDLQYKVVVPQLNDGSGDVYPIAVPGLVNPFSPGYGLFWRRNASSGYELCITDDAGYNWQPLALKGSSSSSDSSSGTSGSNVPGLEATFTVDSLGYNGVYNIAEAYGTVSDTYCLYNVVSIRDAYSGAVYPITTTGWACPEHNKTGVYWRHTEQGYRLQFTEDGGRTWSSLVGGGGITHTVTTSTGVAFVPADPQYTTLMIDQVSGNHISFLSQRADGYSSDTGLWYGLQVALAAYDEPEVKLRLSGHSLVPVLQVKRGSSDWEDFVIGGGSSGSGNSGSSGSSSDAMMQFYYNGSTRSLAYANSDYKGNNAGYAFLNYGSDGKTKCVYSLITPGLINAGNSDYRLAWVDVGSGQYDLKYTTDGGYNWSVLSGGSSSDSNSEAGVLTQNDGKLDILSGDPYNLSNTAPSGVVSLKATYDNNSVSGVNVLLNVGLAAGRDMYSYNNSWYVTGGIRPVISEDGKNLSWEYREINGYGWNPIASEGSGGTSEGSGGITNTVITTSSGVSFVPYDENYTQLIADASSGCINFVTQREDGDITETGLRYGLQVALAAFDKPSVRLRFSGSGASPKLQVQKGDGYAWEDFVISGGSSSSSNTVTFGPIYENSKQYELSLALSDSRTDYKSAIVELKDPTKGYKGEVALGAYLAAPADYDYDSGVTMAVSGMGILVFKRNSNVVTYDLNSLGESSSGSSSDSSVGSISTLSGFAGAYKDYDSSCLDYKLGLDLDPYTQQAYIIIKQGKDNDWEPLALGAGSSTGSSGAIYELNERIDAVSEVVALMDSGTSSGSANGTLPIYRESAGDVGEVGSLSVFTAYSNYVSGQSIMLELRAEGSGCEFSKSQIVLNTAIAAVVESGDPSKALRMYDDAEIDCVKWQLRSIYSPYDWFDAPMAATVLLSDSRYHSSSSYKPLTVSIHADGWMNVENRIKSKSHTIPFEDLAWLCANIDKLKALVE